MAKNRLENKITLKYTAALFIIAILSTLSFYVLYKSIEESSSTAYIVNLSGKQRMLSQHIALDIHRIHNGFHNHENAMHKMSFIKQRLLVDIKEMKKANEILSSGRLSNGDDISLSKEILNIYFGEKNLKNRVDEYVSLAKKLQSEGLEKNIDVYLEAIDAKSELLLMDLDKVVKLHEKEGVTKLQELKTLETIAWVLVLFTLLLEIIFIFQPIVRTMTLLREENSKVLLNLERDVELRTLKLQEANRTLEELASRDPMTGLKNRLTLEDDIEEAIENSKKYSAPFSLLMFDIDWFKEVNDTYGHDVGDSVIISVAEILLASVRKEDRVYRAGGEEFVILLTRISLEDTKVIAEKIRTLIEKEVFYANDLAFHKTISAGLYHSSICEAKSIFHVLKLVDTALYESKEKGRNRITLVNDTTTKHK